ncbi:MAG: hypothetical protein ACI8XB_001354 [Patiriisocius sp.]|jgi:hypothetical protein
MKIIFRSLFCLFGLLSINLYSQVDTLALVDSTQLVLDSTQVMIDSSQVPSYFLVAQFGCPHTDKDMNALDNLNYKWKPRLPFDRAVQATIAAGKACDVYHVLGDWSGQQSVNSEDEGRLATAIKLDITSAKNTFDTVPEMIFDVKSMAGNHINKNISDKDSIESYGLYGSAVQSTLDSLLGERKYDEIRGTENDFDWETYFYIVGNNLFFFLSDRNDLGSPWGKKNSLDENGKPMIGGHPAGSIKKTSLEFFNDVAIKHSDKNIFLHTHQGLPNTVVGTSTKINGWRGHNDLPSETKQWKGTIGALIGPGKNKKGDYNIDVNDSIFRTMFNQWEQLAVGCANTHTHAPINYHRDPVFTGENEEFPRSVNNDHYAKINETFIMNIGNLTKHHGHHDIILAGMHPHGSIWEFVNGSDTLISHKLIIEDARIFRTYYRAKAGDIYKPEERKYILKYPFEKYFVPEDPQNPEAILDLTVEEREDSLIFTFDGEADGYLIVSAEDSVTFNPISYDSLFVENSGKTYLTTYPVKEEKDELMVRHQGTSKKVVLTKQVKIKRWDENGVVRIEELFHPYFKVFAINGSNGKVVYSDGVEVVVSGEAIKLTPALGP